MAERFKEYPEDVLHTHSGRGPIEGCDSCDATDPEGYYRVDRRLPEHYFGFVCAVCYNTFCGKPYCYPTTDTNPAVILTSMAQCTNMILRKLEETGGRLGV